MSTPKRKTTGNTGRFDGSVGTGKTRVPKAAPAAAAGKPAASKKGSRPKLPAAPSPNPHPLPDTHSPSSLLKFKKCPLEYKLSYLPRVKTPGSMATVKGNLFHNTLESVWGLSPEERTLKNAKALLHTHWKDMREDEDVQWSLLADKNFIVSDEALSDFSSHENEQISSAALARIAAAEEGQDLDPDKQATEGEMINQALSFLNNYFKLEDPTQRSNKVKMPSGEIVSSMELEARADFGGTTFRGFIDRLEVVDGNLVISDYKTGKQPFSEKYLEDYWWQLSMYAVVLREQYGVDTKQLRLIYPSSVGGGRKFSKGRVFVKEISSSDIDFHKAYVEGIYQELKRCHETNTWPLVSRDKARLCNWCNFKDVCPDPGNPTGKASVSF